MARFDLNLLSALEALLEGKNVTRAAERLHVTQPTMSGMLQRLRYQFSDELLVRNGRQMELTPFAASIVEPVREALRGIDHLMHAEPIFDPLTSTREFKLMASDYCTAMFLPKVSDFIARNAPGVRLIIRPINAPIGRIVTGEIDMCITAGDLALFGYENCDERLQSEFLFSDEFVFIVGNDHPLDATAGVEDIFRHPHIGVEIDGCSATNWMMIARQSG